MKDESLKHVNLSTILTVAHKIAQLVNADRGNKTAENIDIIDSVC
ncbi:MAG: hypothetical protein RR351_03670 [Christensenella sp.]